MYKVWVMDLAGKGKHYTSKLVTSAPTLGGARDAFDRERAAAPSSYVYIVRWYGKRSRVLAGALGDTVMAGDSRTALKKFVGCVS